MFSRLIRRYITVVTILGFLVFITYIELEFSEFIHKNSTLRTLGTGQFQQIYNIINMTKLNTYSNNITITRSSDNDVYLFSAFKLRYEDYQYPFDNKQYLVNNRNLSTDVIVINSWQRETRHNMTSGVFQCCFWLANNTVVQIESDTKQQQCPTVLRATQYMCPITAESDLIKMVSAVTGNRKCHVNINHYIKLEIGHKERNSDLAVCTKLTYDSVNAASLVEWFEAQRLLGVDKVITYPFRLDANPNARKVLKYYEAVGFLEVINGFYMPEIDRYPRIQGIQHVQAWNDQQVLVFDCLSRLSTYKYIGLYDKDEYIVPELKTPLQGSLKSFVEEMFLDENVAGIIFDTKLHITTWRPMVEKAHLFMERFLNATPPTKDRVKTIHMPQRIIPGSVRTHRFYPISGYRGLELAPEKGANHHYRTCRSEWKVLSDKEEQNQFGNRTKCDEFERFTSTDMLLLSKAIEKNVLKIIDDLRIPTN